MTSKQDDEKYSPYYIVNPILKYIPKDKTVWCGFDENWSAFYNTFKENGYKVVRSSLAEGQDFFQYEPHEWDIFVSNPPFSKKQAVLERLNQFGKPYAILLPLPALQGVHIYKQLEDGIQLLSFDKRVHFHSDRNEGPKICTPFATAYFCKGILPKDLILEELVRYERGLS